MHIKINNKDIKIKSSLLISAIKDELYFENNEYCDCYNSFPQKINEKLQKRLEAPLPLDKTFIYDALNEFEKINMIVREESFKIFL